MYLFQLKITWTGMAMLLAYLDISIKARHGLEECAFSLGLGWLQHQHQHNDYRLEHHQSQIHTVFNIETEYYY